MKIRLRLALALSLLLLPGGVFALDKPAPTSPGKYAEWGGEIDELEIVAPFKLADYSSIVVEPFDASATPLPEEKDNTYAPVKNVLARTAPPFVEGLSGELKKPAAAVGETGKSAGAGVLVVRGKVVTMDPGSKAARYWGGFGAGAARTELQGEVVDGGSRQGPLPLPPGAPLRDRPDGRGLREAAGPQPPRHRPGRRRGPEALLSPPPLP
jgi:hypothetical protein